MAHPSIAVTYVRAVLTNDATKGNEDADNEYHGPAGPVLKLQKPRLALIAKAIGASRFSPTAFDCRVIPN